MIVKKIRIKIKIKVKMKAKVKVKVKVQELLKYLTSQYLCHAPSWLVMGEPSHMHIHLTMDHDSTQLNALPHMGNMEYSLTQTSPTSMDISRQAGMAH